MENTTNSTVMELLDKLVSYACSLGDENSAIVVEWLDATRKMIEQENQRQLQSVSVERVTGTGSVTREQGAGSQNLSLRPAVGRKRIHCRYSVVLHFNHAESSSIAVHFPTSVAECLYLMILIASSAYDDHEGGFPRNGHLIFTRHACEVSAWVRRVAALLYQQCDVDELMRKLDIDESRNQAMSKIRSLFRTLDAEQASIAKRTLENCNYYLLANPHLPIQLPAELQPLGIELKNILQTKL